MNVIHRAIKWHVEDVPLAALNNICIEHGLSLNVEDMAVNLMDIYYYDEKTRRLL